MEMPKDFLIKMEGLLKEEYDAFIKSFSEEKKQGLRVNTLKVDVKEFMEKSPFMLKPVPWAQTGFYYGSLDRPGKHPYHEAGLYYIQEPSAMAVAELVAPQPGERILDLCAAPGGKTTHMAAKMNQQGLLVANEIHPARAKILAQNVERMGIKNAVVMNEKPEALVRYFPAYFDRILVDAPCSGEGMFRKDPQTCLEWSKENVLACADRQSQILAQAAELLKPGGRLVYSTCTFSPEENEGVINRFIGLNPFFEIEGVQVYEGFSRGRAQWVPEGSEYLEKTLRLWPHRLHGEGHYIAVLKKTTGKESGVLKAAEGLTDSKIPKDYLQFLKEAMIDSPRGKYHLFGDQLYILPEEMIPLKNLRVVRPGWHLGTLKKNRFEPSHALALTLTPEEVNHHINLKVDSPEVEKYLKGEALIAQGPKGWYLVTVEGYSLGWGKLVDQRLKNHYPKGLRWV